MRPNSSSQVESLFQMDSTITSRSMMMRSDTSFAPAWRATTPKLKAKRSADDSRVAFESGDLRAYESSDLLMGLFKVQPLVALDAFLTGGDARAQEIFGFFDMTGANHPHPIDPVGIPTLIGWADRDSMARYPAIARVIRLFTAVRENTTWNPAIAELIRGAPNPLEVAAALIQRLRPPSWSGSYASVLELNASLLDTLENGGHVSVIRFVEEQKALLLAEAAEARSEETDRDRRRDERFEY